jgi:Pilus formation protein N terminal region
MKGAGFYRKFTLFRQGVSSGSSGFARFRAPSSTGMRKVAMALKRKSGIVPSQLIGLMAALGLFTATQGIAAAQETSAPDAIQVTLDQAKLVKLPAGAETIVIGNPAIADITVQNNGVMVITGRANGRTNFIALDSAGAIISESTVMVTNMTQGRVLITRGLDQSSYDCSPNCLPTMALGDEERHFGKVLDQATRREGISKKK